MSWALLRKFLLGLLLALAVTALFLALSGFEGVAAALSSLPGRSLLLAALFSALIYAGRFGKWVFFLSVLGIRVPAWPNLGIFLAGLSLGITPGKAGEVVKSYFLQREFGVDFSLTAPIIVAERLTGVVGCFSLCMLSLAVLGRGSFWGAAALAVLLALIAGLAAVLKSERLRERIFSLLGRLPLLVRHEAGVRQMYASLLGLLGVQSLFLAVLISVGYWSMECLLFYTLLSGFGAELTLAEAVFTLTAVSIGSGLTMLPGSVGAIEGGLLGALMYHGLGAGEAGAAVLLHRLFAMWDAVLLGSVVLAKKSLRLLRSRD